MTIAGNQIQGSSYTNGFFIEVDGKNIILYVFDLRMTFRRCREQMIYRFISCYLHLFPYMKYRVNRESRATCSRIDHRFIHLRIEHFDTHIDNITGCEVLPFFTLAAFAHQILESLVHYVEIGIEQFDAFERGDADGQMRGSQSYFCIFSKYASPFAACLAEEVLYFIFQLNIALSGVAEYEIVIFLRSSDLFVIQFGEYQFEHLLEYIDAGICQNFILHFENQVFKRLACFGQFVVFDQIVHSKRSLQDILQCLVHIGNIRNILEIVRILALIIGYRRSVSPYGHTCTRRMGVRFQLFSAIFGFRFFQLNYDVGDVSIVIIPDHDICALGFTSEINRIFKSQPAFRITVIIYQFSRI